MTKKREEKPSLISRVIGALLGALAVFVVLLSIEPDMPGVAWAGALLLGSAVGWFLGLWLIELLSFMS